MEVLDWNVTDNLLYIKFNKEFKQISIIKIDNETSFDKFQYNFLQQKDFLKIYVETDNILVLIDNIDGNNINKVFKYKKQIQEQNNVYAIIKKIE